MTQGRSRDQAIEAPSAPAVAGDSSAEEAGGRAAVRRGQAEQREGRVAAGLSELERWLADQIGQGIAQARQTGPAGWDDLARRLVDAQAPGVAGMVTRLPRVLGAEDWPGLLLGEYALLHLLAVAHRRAGALPGPLRQTVRTRVGFPVTRESVLAGPVVRDLWDVVGCRDEEQERLVARRVWLAGRATGRAAMVLSFSPVGQPRESFPPPGTTIDADLAFYPGASPLRALVAVRHGDVEAGPPPGTEISRVPALIAEVLAADPWADSWPLVLAGVVPCPDGLADGAGADVLTAEGTGADGAGAETEGGGDAGADGLRTAGPGADSEGPGGEGPGDEGPRGEWDALPLHLPLHPAAGVPWRLLAVSGGRPVTVAAEWTPRGLLPLTVWDEEGEVVRL
ncbi:SWIM zinc finger family protein [Microbispora amethystogenes]|uniref:SWIM zinc finger family protein n=1 Tax=Microbispora amethystogenes TaxID=1427754 RepID=UPI00195305AE|nr:SWIM zinc finger family protein [Microbispora amethystogenes]